MSISFEERFLEVITSESVNFKKIFINKEYLIVSKDFIVDKYYILSANEDNFLHLTGVKTVLEPKKFFEKANSKTFKYKIFFHTFKTNKRYYKKENQSTSKITRFI
ncbi:PBECR4 domain-containing protein [Oceanotoga teriensis]|uniref:PBECR4 domain-containing protein n=1 Tax=Oceanotoga TaxID=1255275 RepID=UPI000D6AD8C5